MDSLGTINLHMLLSMPLKVSQAQSGGSMAKHVMAARLEQPKKAFLPIDVTYFGIVMDVRLEQSEKAQPAIVVTESGIMVLLHPAINVLDAPSIIALHWPFELYVVLL